MVTITFQNAEVSQAESKMKAMVERAQGKEEDKD